MRKANGLEYEVRGDGPPVLLIHGSHLAGAMLPLVRQSALARRYKLVRYHRRGFAGSDRAVAPFGIDAQARDAAELCGTLGIERAHVVAHSYGAVTALQVASATPDLVHSLTLLEPPLRSPAEAAAMTEAFAPIVAQYRAGDAAGAVDGFMAFIGGPDWRSEVERVLPGGAAQADRDAATFFEVEIPALDAWQFDEAAFGRFDGPILFVLGSESGPLFEGPMRRFCARVPRTEAVVLPGLNHLLQIRRPAQVAEPIADFLARHPL